MAKLQVLSVKKIVVNASGLANVQVPDSGFHVAITVDKAQEAHLNDAKYFKALEAVAKDI